MIFLRATDPKRDAAALHSVMGDPQSCRYLSHPAKKSVAETAAQLSEWLVMAPDHDWAIVKEGAANTIGRVTIYEKDDGNWEAGIIICPAHQGCGFAAKAMRLAIDRVDQNDAPRRIMADIDPENTASLNLFTRLGFQTEGRLRQASITHIGVRDSVIMSLVNTDPRLWRS